MSLDLTLKNHQFNFKMANLRHNKIYEFEDFRLDAAQKLLFRGGEQISLTPKAVETLLALVERQGEVIGKDELMEKIWADTIVEESNLSQYLHILRKTFGATSDGKPFIETLKRRGYRFNGAVRVAENSNNSVSQNGSNNGKIENSEIENANERQAKISGSRPRHVERRGNVLALADWTETAEKPDETKRAAQFSDDRRLISKAKPKSRLAYTTAAFAIVILLSAFSFNWIRSPAANSSAMVRNELTILPLTNGETVSQATIAPDGKFFAYSEIGVDESRLWLQQIGEPSRLEIIVPFRGAIHSLSFAPDSKTIYFLARQKSGETNTLYRVSTLGGVPTRITDDISQPVSFSPDGSEMVFVRGNKANQTQLVIAASDGTRERVVLTRQDSELIMPNAAWSPDGKQIAFGLYETRLANEERCTIAALDLEGGKIKTLSAEKWSCYRMAWTRDGAGLIFIGTKQGETMTTRRDQVYYLALDTGEARRLTADGNRHDPLSLGVTDAGEILTLPYSRVSQIWSVGASGDLRTARQITSGQSDGRGGIVPLPGGDIAFLARAGDGFGIFQTSEAGERRAPIISDATMEELRAAPDAKFFVFAAKVEGFAHLFRSEIDGSNRRQLTFGATNEFDSTVSPDGNWIVYASSGFDGSGEYRSALEKIPSAEGGAPVRLLDERCDTPHFSPDGKMISCIAGEKIRVISSENGATLETFQTAQSPSLNMGARWTADGRKLVYVVYQKNACNLWQQPIVGNASALTDFTSGEIYNFAFAPDGTRLYLARGNPIRNATLIRNFK